MKFRQGLTIALLALLAAPLAGAADGWRMVTTQHFRVLSQVNDQQTAKWIRNYEQFIAATSEATGIKPTALPPLTIILFARDKDFTAYKLVRPDGKAAKVAGQFVRLGGNSTISLAMDSEQAETRRTIYHEATHWLMSVDPARQPAWFSEGIAEMLSTFEQAGSKVNWAKPIDAHLAQLQASLLPLSDFLTRTDALQDQDKENDRFYAQSWAFVHFMMLSDKTRPQLLSRFLTAYRTKSGEASMREAFGENLAALERDFNRYVLQQSFSFFSLAAAPVADPPASVPAPPGIVEAALGTMALGVGRNELAQQHARRAIELSPELPGGHEVLAYLASRNKDNAALGQHAEAALRAGSRDAQIYLLMADSLARNATGNFQEVSVQRIRLLNKAIDLNPNRRESYRQLASDAMFVDKPQAEDLSHLEQGLNRFKDDDWIKVGVAAMRVRMGNGGDALQVINTALRPESTLTAEQRRSVGSVRRNLLMQAMDAELRTAQQANDFTAARAVIARYREAAGGDPEVVTYLQRRDSQFEMNQLMEKVRVAMANGRNAELNPLFDQILAHPALTPAIRNLVESARRDMK